MNIYDKVKQWYVKKGISTSPFFDNSSTEIGLDSMMDDFVYRMLEREQKLEQILQSEGLLNTELSRRNTALEKELFILKNTTVDSELYGNMEFIVAGLQKELELRTQWTNHHKRVSELDAEKKHLAEKQAEEYRKELIEANRNRIYLSGLADDFRKERDYWADRCFVAMTELENSAATQESESSVSDAADTKIEN